MIITAYGIKLRLVEITDAAFIVAMRTDPSKAAFLSTTSTDIALQEDWIRAYKTREAAKKEFYFIIENKENTPVGTIRVYDLQEKTFEVGSWVTIPNLDSSAGILGEILGKSVGFYLLGYDTCVFEVMKNNKSVLRYHQLYATTLTGEDETHRYFSLEKSNFEKTCTKIIKPLGYELDRLHGAI